MDLKGKSILFDVTLKICLATLLLLISCYPNVNSHILKHHHVNVTEIKIDVPEVETTTLQSIVPIRSSTPKSSVKICIGSGCNDDGASQSRQRKKLANANITGRNLEEEKQSGGKENGQVGRRLNNGEGLTSMEEKMKPQMEEDADEEAWKNEVFNMNITPSWKTSLLNHSDVELLCLLANPCLASELVLPVCGSDGKSYLNLGVFICAQKCNTDLLLKEVGFCPNYEPPEIEFTTTTPATTTTPPSHHSTEARMRMRGSFIQPILKLLGLHVHDDGGFYLADETKHQEWWNI